MKAEMAAGKRMGRPLKTPKGGERVALGLRVTAKTKKRLDEAALESGRSQSQEAELRLEQSFRDDDQLVRTLERSFGPEVTGIVLVLARAMYDAGTIASWSAGTRAHLGGVWVREPYAYSEAVKAAAIVLKALRPAGEPKPPKGPRLEGDMVALALLRRIAEAEGQLRFMRELLGELTPSTEAIGKLTREVGLAREAREAAEGKKEEVKS